MFFVSTFAGLISTTNRKLDREKQEEHILEVSYPLTAIPCFFCIIPPCFFCIIPSFPFNQNWSQSVFLLRNSWTSLGEFIHQWCVAYSKLMSNIYALQEIRSDAKLGQLTSVGSIPVLPANKVRNSFGTRGRWPFQKQQVGYIRYKKPFVFWSHPWL